MTGVADLLRAIAALLWPLFAFVALYAFRREIRDVLARVRKGKLLGSEFELDARAVAQSAEIKADAALASVGEPRSLAAGEIPRTPTADLRALAREYDQLRLDPARGGGRGQEVNQLVGRMIRAAGSLGEFDVQAALTSPSEGERLAAYAYLFQHPQAAYLLPLVDTLTKAESTGNGQYWAIQAIGKVLPLASGDVRARAMAVLRPLLQLFAPNSDRGYALRQVLGTTRVAGTAAWEDPYGI